MKKVLLATIVAIALASQAKSEIIKEIPAAVQKRLEKGESRMFTITPPQPEAGKPFTFTAIDNAQPREATCLALSPDGKKVVVGTPDGLIQITLATGKKHLAGKGSRVTAVTFTPSGDVIAAFQVKKVMTIHWYDQTKEGINLTITKDDRVVTEIHYFSKGLIFLMQDDWRDRPQGGSLAVNPNGKLLAVMMDKEVRLLDATTGKLITKAKPAERTDRRQWAETSFSPDGKKLMFNGGSELDLASHEVKLVGNLAVYATDGTVIKFTGNRPSTDFPNWYNHLYKGSTLVYDTDLCPGGPGKLQIVGTKVAWSHFHYINLVEIKDGKNLVSSITTGPDGFKNFINGLAMAPDGKTIISAGDDGAVKVWDTTSGKLVTTLLEGAAK